MAQNYMVKTIWNGKTERRYYKTLGHAMRRYNELPNACIYAYNERTFEYDMIDCH